MGKRAGLEEVHVFDAIVPSLVEPSRVPWSPSTVQGRGSRKRAATYFASGHRVERRSGYRRRAPLREDGDRELPRLRGTLPPGSNTTCEELTPRE